MNIEETLPDHLSSILSYYRPQLPQPHHPEDLSPGNAPVVSSPLLNLRNPLTRSLVSVAAFIGVKRMIDCSGLVLNKSGLILTSAKLVRFPPNAQRRYYHIIVRFFDGEVLEAKEEYVDFHMNFVILKVQPRRLLEPVQIIPHKHFSSQLKVSILGRSFFKLSLNQAAGVLLSYPPPFGCDELLSTTCTTSKDCEGGPIITESGEVIGINFVDDAGFAHLLPSSCILCRWMTWKNTGGVMYPWFGLTTIQADKVLHDTLEVLGISPGNKAQLLVKHVYSGCPADELKILPGDRVISFDGCEVFESQQYFKLLRGMSTCPGHFESTGMVELEIKRQANDQTVLVPAEILPSTDRKLSICWPFNEEIWCGEPLEGSQVAFLYSFKPVALLKREQGQSSVQE